MAIGFLTLSKTATNKKRHSAGTGQTASRRLTQRAQDAERGVDGFVPCCVEDCKEYCEPLAMMVELARELYRDPLGGGGCLRARRPLRWGFKEKGILAIAVCFPLSQRAGSSKDLKGLPGALGENIEPQASLP